MWNSVWWSHISESNLSESFSLVLKWGYFIFHPGPLWDPKYHFAESTTTVLANCSKKGRVELCVMKSHIRKQSLRKLLSSFYVRIHAFSPWAPMAPKYDFAESTTTVLANCSRKGSVELCVMKSHNRKQSFIKLLSSYYVRIFPSSPWVPMGSQISLCNFHDKCVSKLLPEV